MQNLIWVHNLIGINLALTSENGKNLIFIIKVQVF
jgi:hypothetical protein